jgi:hypothetical protein
MSASWSQRRGRSLNPPEHAPSLAPSSSPPAKVNPASCHTLIGRDSHAPGGDLAIAELSARDIASFVHVMPVHLSLADVDAVAFFVHAAGTDRRKIRRGS